FYRWRRTFRQRDAGDRTGDEPFGNGLRAKADRGSRSGAIADLHYPGGAETRGTSGDWNVVSACRIGCGAGSRGRRTYFAGNRRRGASRRDSLQRWPPAARDHDPEGSAIQTAENKNSRAGEGAWPFAERLRFIA